MIRINFGKVTFTFVNIIDLWEDEKYVCKNESFERCINLPQKVT